MYTRVGVGGVYTVLSERSVTNQLSAEQVTNYLFLCLSIMVSRGTSRRGRAGGTTTPSRVSTPRSRLRTGYEEGAAGGEVGRSEAQKRTVNERSPGEHGEERSTRIRTERESVESMDGVAVGGGRGRHRGAGSSGSGGQCR